MAARILLLDCPKNWKSQQLVDNRWTAKIILLWCFMLTGWWGKPFSFEASPTQVDRTMQESIERDTVNSDICCTKFWQTGGTKWHRRSASSPLKMIRIASVLPHDFCALNSRFSFGVVFIFLMFPTRLNGVAKFQCFVKALSVQNAYVQCFGFFHSAFSTSFMHISPAPSGVPQNASAVPRCHLKWPRRPAKKVGRKTRPREDGSTNPHERERQRHKPPLKRTLPPASYKPGCPSRVPSPNRLASSTPNFSRNTSLAAWMVSNAEGVTSLDTMQNINRKELFDSFCSPLVTSFSACSHYFLICLIFRDYWLCSFMKPISWFAVVLVMTLHIRCVRITWINYTKHWPCNNLANPTAKPFPCQTALNIAPTDLREAQKTSIQYCSPGKWSGQTRK